MLNQMTFKYAATVSVMLLVFANFIACGSQMYQVSMEDDFEESKLPPEALDPASTTYGIHALSGWKDLPIAFRFGESMNKMQKDSLAAAMKTWEKVVGKQLFKAAGTDSPKQFPDLFSSLSDGINGHYLDADWAITQKPVVVLATTIWDNDGGDISSISTADIRFNEENYTIGDSLLINPTGGREVVDMESLSLHELGHLLGLAHVDSNVDPMSIMNPQLFIGVGLTSRKVSRGDIERMQVIYGCKNKACDVDTLVKEIEMNKNKETGTETESTEAGG